MIRSTADAPLPPLQSGRLLDQVRERIRYLHYSLRTEQAYVHWVRAFVRHHGLRHPRSMGQVEVEAFLSWLAGERHVAVPTSRCGAAVTGNVAAHGTGRQARTDPDPTSIWHRHR